MRNKSHIEKRPGSPTGSCVSMRSDKSMDEPLRFKGPGPTSDQCRIKQRPESPTESCVSMSDEPLRFKGAGPASDQSAMEQRPGSPTGSCVSMRSDKSKDEPLRFKGAGPTPDQSHMEQRPGSPTGSCVSMRSDQSKDEPLRFKGAGPTPEQSAMEQRPGSPTESCVSMRSDKSKDEPLRFKGAGPTPDQSRMEQRPGSPTGSCVSMRSDKSKDEPLRFKGAGPTPYQRDQKRRHKQDSSGQDKQQDLPHIFEVLEEKIIIFLKTELQRLKQILSPNYGENIENKAEDESDAREGVLQMALHFLRKMEHQDLADELIDNEMNVGCQKDLKRNLKNKYQSVFEGIAKQGSSVLLEKIYTDLYITEGESEKVNEEHEVRQIEYRSKKPAGQDRPIKCADIFKPSSIQNKPIRRVLTKGVAGIGKTISVQKYVLDWAEGNDNQEIKFIFPLCFRELNIMRENKYSLMDLLHHFFPELKEFTLVCQKKYQVLFVLDGLDECRLQLEFQGNESLTDMRAVKSLDVILTNLIKGNLFPSALLWITSRPAAAGRIPPECVDLVTEVQGFNDSQKEEYFRKRISDESCARKIISHIKSSRSLHIMCHIPVFCWIAAMVLQMIYSTGHIQVPKTLTEMYTFFLMFQTRQRSAKFDNLQDPEPQWNHELILRLGKLAYEQLEKGNLIFYEEDLRECDIDVKEATVCSGMCTQIFREESGIFVGTVFCFVHLSIQEYLAALYAFVMMANEGNDIISPHHAHQKTESMTILQKSAVDKALIYDDGRFDLFLRFLLGLSLESNQTLLRGLVSRRQVGVMDKIRTVFVRAGNDKTIRYIKNKIREAPSPERMINLFHCLNELNDHSLVEQIQSYLSAGKLSKAKLSPGQWSALVFVLVSSDQNLDVFDLKKFIRSDEALLRLKPVVEESHTTLLDSCGLTSQSCTTLASILCKESSKLRKLDISDNCIRDIGVKNLCSGLKNPNCALETLRLSGCSVTGEGYAALAAALKSNPSHLEELDLRGNDPGDSGVELLTSALTNQKCKLRLLSDGAEKVCENLTSVLGGNPLLLTELDLRGKIPGDSGVKQLCALLEDSHCRVKTLNLSHCGVTGEGYAALTSALKSNPSHLEELDLRGNDPGNYGVELLTSALTNLKCKIRLLSDEAERACEYLTSVVGENPLLVTELNLDGKIPGDSGVKQLCALLEDSHCRVKKLRLYA
ncbi:NLR family CARD domain-containing protein 3-like [Engraulis encrasicolus]|uniref:NLR family CARD domain-containing protein 3-like n=1 Tax=Engraulis encrasicolus TaxID=184585 RepID=UPI002FD1ECAB